MRANEVADKAAKEAASQNSSQAHTGLERTTKMGRGKGGHVEKEDLPQDQAGSQNLAPMWAQRQPHIMLARNSKRARGKLWFGGKRECTTGI